MDSSEIINKLRAKTILYNLQPQVLAAKVLASGKSYTFPDFETKNEYMYGQYLSSMSTVVIR